MLIVYLTTSATVTSAPATETAVDAAAPTNGPFRETNYGHFPQYPALPYAAIQDGNPSYLYPYPQMPYYNDPRNRFYYPLTAYQNGQSGYPQTAVNGYPQYGYQIPSGYPYVSGYQYPSGYYPYQYGK
jgi:hypothetical protein